MSAKTVAVCLPASAAEGATGQCEVRQDSRLGEDSGSVCSRFASFWRPSFPCGDNPTRLTAATSEVNLV
jgi:hypothetical protein